MGFRPISNFPFRCDRVLHRVVIPFWDDYSLVISAHPIAQKIDPAKAQVLRN
jgi:hypothetical protein